MNLFEAVKEAVPMKAAAEHFGIQVGRGGMVRCPFHNDRTPSLKLYDEHFYCFGCAAHGDVVDFVARLFNISPKEAAEKLAREFGVDYGKSRKGPQRSSAARRQLSALEHYQESERRCYRVLCRYRHLLADWREQYAPGPEDDAWHPLYCEAMRNETYLDYLLDEVFLNGEPEDKAKFIQEHGKEVLALEARLQEFDGRDHAEHHCNSRCAAQR